MIISCDSCHKKFEINSDLIPDSGRLLQCSNCDNKWFFTNAKNKDLDQAKRIVNESAINKDIENKIKKDNKIQINEKLNDNNDNNDKIQDHVKIVNPNVKSKNKVLRLILVFIVSFIALIIFLDTFQQSISLIIPNIETILYNLYEIIEDISLFLKDLI